MKTWDRTGRVCRRRGGIKIRGRSWITLLLLCLVVPPLLLYASSPPSRPSTISSFTLSHSLFSKTSCSHALCLHRSQFYSRSCYANCFPRIRGICFHASKVQICKDSVDVTEDNFMNFSDSFACEDSKNNLCAVPPIMRFHGERLTLPVVHSSFCVGHNQKWIRGLSMVADQRYLPYGKPNPHHEAEKLIPVLLMYQKFGELMNMTFYWFSSVNDVSKWAAGFMKAVSIGRIVRFLDLPKNDEPAICFEDAVTFSLPTNLWYIPDEGWNEWMRRTVLHHCSIPSDNASYPARTAVILDRHGGTRYLKNKRLVAETVHRVLNISVQQSFGGVGSFCEQVHAAATADLFVVPHGSQNTNLLFARPDAVVIEVFPYLYYTDALQNLTHAAHLKVYAILGKRPEKNFLMWIFSFLGWDRCFSLKWCRNYARSQPIVVDIGELERVLLHFSQGHLPPLASLT